tara:strand:- start:383 stop:757 length:375 start_codon:yes stop_codon:yes gene_type:complete
MPLGFIYTGSTYISPDKSLKRSSKPKVLVSRFGDGYEQRLADGINSIKQEFTATFKLREKVIIDDVVAFLDARKGALAFPFRFPDTNGTNNETEIKVVCEDYTISYDYGDFYSLSVKLRRVYEP